MGGNEGVGQVMEVGHQVKTLKVGDWVIPRDAGVGERSMYIHKPGVVSVFSSVDLWIDPRRYVENSSGCEGR